jgi:type I restriction enzyme, R subunit
MSSSAMEIAFQNDIIAQMQEHGWVLGEPSGYNRELALYEADCLAYVKSTQPKTWAKYCKLYPKEPEKQFIAKVASQLNKTNPNATDKSLRSFGTLGVLRHELRDKSASFKLCQFKPEHDLNEELQAVYAGNILRIVPELVYSPYATQEHLESTGVKAKAWRIDLVCFLNGIPIVTMELKSEFKQSVANAVKQYKKTRLPKDPATKKPEPLLTFKRGALVHFAVSQYEVHMTTRLNGSETRFLPFNKGTSEGASGNDVPKDVDRYATDYLWNEVLLPENILHIIGRFIHLEIEEKETWEGLKYKQESLIFPRYHQWDLVQKLISATCEEGPGHKYLAQHSAGSGKSNSIAWTAHQLASLYGGDGEKVFHSVIVVTDRTVLDQQLQDTIYQFEHADGVVGCINKEEGQGSKSEKLAVALENSQPIVIVTIQTFPFVLKAIENSVSLKERRYAIIADEAHSSQSGATARQMKEVLSVEGVDEDEELSAEDMIEASVAARQSSPNLSYYAFTATPKSKTLELFGRLPKPDEAPSKDNLPEPFHVYSMRQAIEEGYILDVLRNYTSYKVAYNLAQKMGKPDAEVDAKKAKVRLNRWVRLHDYNIAQKVQVIVEHFKGTVKGLLGGQAKAMIVTGSRKEAVRFKLGFDKYIAEKGYTGMTAMVAFSGDVQFNKDDPQSAALLGEKFTESSMNPGLKGRKLRKAFDSGDYNVMIVAEKFQTGFDQPKLCAMYVDKKMGGVECVQTLSRLNRIYPGKEDTYVIDFFNDPKEILESFKQYHKTATLLDVSDPNHIFDLFEKLRGSGIFLWTEVTHFCEVFYEHSKSNAAIANICKPAVERWQHRYKAASEAYAKEKALYARVKATGDTVLIANAEESMTEAKKALDELGTFKKDLASYTRYYEFMSQIVDYDSTDLEKLSLYARHLCPMLREQILEDDEIDLSSVTLSHYRLSKIKEQKESGLSGEGGPGIPVPDGVGTRKPRDKQEEFLSRIIQRLNELFITDGLTAKDLINYAYTIRDKVTENDLVMDQIENNSPEQALLGTFPKAVETAIMDSSENHNNQMMQYFNNPELAKGFNRVVLDMILVQLAKQATLSPLMKAAEDGPTWTT